MFVQLINSYENKNGIHWYYSFCKKINSSNLNQTELKELLSFLNIQKTQINIFSEEVADLIKLVMIYTLEVIRCVPNRVDDNFDSKIYSYLDIINTVLNPKFQKMNFKEFSKKTVAVAMFSSFFDSLIDEQIYQYFIDKDQYYQITSFVDNNQETWLHSMINEINRSIDTENKCIRNADVKGSDMAFDKTLILKNKFRIASLYAEKIGILSYKDGETLNNLVTSFFSDLNAKSKLAGADSDLNFFENKSQSKKKIKEIINHKDFLDTNLIAIDENSNKEVISFIINYLINENDSQKIKHDLVTGTSDAIELFDVVYTSDNTGPKTQGINNLLIGYSETDAHQQNAHQNAHQQLVISAGNRESRQHTAQHQAMLNARLGNQRNIIPIQRNSLVISGANSPHQLTRGRRIEQEVGQTGREIANIVSANDISLRNNFQEKFKTLSTKNKIDYTIANIMRYKKVFGINENIDTLTKLEIECVKILEKQYMITMNNELFQKLVASQWMTNNSGKQIFRLQKSNSLEDENNYFTDFEVIERYKDILFSNEILFRAIQCIQTNTFFSYLNSVVVKYPGFIGINVQQPIINVVYDLIDLVRNETHDETHDETHEMELVNNMMIYGKNKFIVAENREKSFFIGTPEISEEQFFALIIKAIPECNLFSLSTLHSVYIDLCETIEQEIEEHPYDNETLKNVMSIFTNFLYEQGKREFDSQMFLKMFELIKNSVIENYAYPKLTVSLDFDHGTQEFHQTKIETNYDLLVFCLHILFVKNKKLKKQIQDKLVVLSPLYYAVKQKPINETAFFEVVYPKDFVVMDNTKRGPAQQIDFVDYSKVYSLPQKYFFNSLNSTENSAEHAVNETVLNTVFGTESYSVLINFLANDNTQEINTFLNSNEFKDESVKITKTPSYMPDENIKNFKFEGIDLNLFDEVVRDIYSTNNTHAIPNSSNTSTTNSLGDSFSFGIAAILSEHEILKHNRICELIRKKFTGSRDKLQKTINFCEGFLKTVVSEKHEFINYDEFVLALNELKIFFESILLIVQNKNTFEHTHYITEYIVNEKTIIIPWGNIDAHNAIAELLEYFILTVETLKA